MPGLTCRLHRRQPLFLLVDSILPLWTPSRVAVAVLRGDLICAAELKVCITENGARAAGKVFVARP
jgi:hypothetical protein